MPRDNELTADFLARFARHLAHELNNPIGAISSAVYLIEDFVATAETSGGTKRVETELIAPFVGSIHEESDRLRDIVQEFVRFCATTSVLAMPMELSEFIAARVEELRRDGMRVEFERGELRIPIQADAGQLGMSLRFLIGDALRVGATCVRAFLRVQDDQCMIELHDDRPSMPGEEQALTAFDIRFERRDGSGLGLKLPLARKIIELHGGEIAMKTIEGQTVVTILLPIRSESESAR
jgi:signal transduction histidine kinase